MTRSTMTQHLVKALVILAFLAIFSAASASAQCVQDNQTLCLNGGRFQVTATFVTGDGTSGQAQAVRLTNDTGYFFFFDAANVELIVKVLDACGLNGNYWVFAGGLTNVEVTITVTDTQSGTSQVYTNPQGTAFQPLQATGDFPVCP